MNKTLKDIINEIEQLKKDPNNYDSPYDRVASEQNEILDTCIDIINKHMEIEVGDIVYNEYTDKDIIVVDTSARGIVAGMYKLNKQVMKGEKYMDFDLRAEAIVTTYIEEHLDKTDTIPDFEVFTVWKCKTLQNWKYLLSSTLFDGMYYELTYNGDKQEWYLDAYKKFENRVIPEI